MADELRGVEIRLERAHEHIDALKHESRMFMMGFPPPYASAIDLEPVGGDYIVRAKITQQPPVRLGLLAADSAHNLRAALDMLAWQLALKSESPPDDSDRLTAFPLGKDPDAWESRRTKRMLKFIPPRAVPIIQSFQPYSRPELFKLGIIQAIDNWAKHHAIPDLLSFRVSRIRMLTPYEIVSFSERAFDDGDEICRVRRVEAFANSEERFQALMMCHVSFAQNGPGQGGPIDFLQNSFELIRDSIVPAFAEFFP